MCDGAYLLLYFVGRPTTATPTGQRNRIIIKACCTTSMYSLRYMRFKSNRGLAHRNLYAIMSPLTRAIMSPLTSDPTWAWPGPNQGARARRPACGHCLWRPGEA